MAMVSIDPKALEHACLCAGRSVHHFDRMGDDLPLRASIVAHARAIERFGAFRQEVSDAIESCMLGPIAEERLNPFILPKPDPLVVEAREICARVCEGWVDIPKHRAAAYRDGLHDDEADFAYALNALRKASEESSSQPSKPVAAGSFGEKGDGRY